VRVRVCGQVKPLKPDDDRYSREALYVDMFAGLAAAGCVMTHSCV